MTTQMITTWNNIIADPKKVLVMWAEDETSHKPLMPKPDSQRGPPLFSSIKAKRRGICRGKAWANTGCFMRLKKEAISVTWKVQDEAASADGGAAARYPDDLAEIVNEGSSLNSRLGRQMKQPSIRRYHQGLSQLERSQCLYQSFERQADSC